MAEINQSPIDRSLDQKRGQARPRACPLFCSFVRCAFFFWRVLRALLSYRASCALIFPV